MNNADALSIDTLQYYSDHELETSVTMERLAIQKRMSIGLLAC